MRARRTKMAFINFNFFSEALGMQTEAYVIIPQRQTSGQIGVDTAVREEKYKCLYLLQWGRAGKLLTFWRQ